MKIKLSDYADIEAEEGSDNENHDHIVKKIVEEYEIETRDDDLEDLVVKDSNTNKGINKIIQKFKNDEIKADKGKIIKLIKNNFKAKQRKYSELNQVTQSQDSLRSRIKKSRKDEKETNFKEKLLNMSKYKKTLTEFAEDDENLEEVNDIISNYEKEIKQKLSSESSEAKKNFLERLNDNEKILENVVNLNDGKEKIPKPSNKIGMGYNFKNSQNSFLNAIKTDKYKREKRDIIQVQGNVFSVFRNNKNTKLDSEKKAKFSNIFKRDEVDNI